MSKLVGPTFPEWSDPAFLHEGGAPLMEEAISTEAPISGERLAKLIGMLGSAHAGERANAIEAVDQELARHGLTWFDVGALAAHGKRDRDREKLLARFVSDRLKAGLQYAWCMTGEQSKWLRELVARCDRTGGLDVGAAALTEAIAIADQARRQAGR